MEKSTPQTRLSRGLYRRPLILFPCLGALWLMVLCLVGENGLATILRCTETVRSLEADVEALRTKNQALREEIARLQTDDFAVEVIAREQLLMVGPGDTIFLFVEPDSAAVP